MYMKWITTFESSNTYSVLRLITSENETRNVHLQGHKNQNVIIHNYKLGLIEVKHIFFNWCGVPNETLKKFSLAILHNLQQPNITICFQNMFLKNLNGAAKTERKKKQRYELHFYIFTAASTTIKLSFFAKEFHMLHSVTTANGNWSSPHACFKINQESTYEMPIQTVIVPYSSCVTADHNKQAD